MKPGDLVEIRPAKQGIYVIVRRAVVEKPAPDGKDLWELWGPHIEGPLIMSETWMDIVSEGK